MRPDDTWATVDVRTAFPGVMSFDVYPWHYIRKSTRYHPLLGTAALLDLEASRTNCPEQLI